MKKTLIFLALLLQFMAKETQAQTWQWATLLEGTLGADEVVIKGIDVDATGNSYVTGYYTGQLNSSVINTSNLQDGFVAMFDASGVFQWAHKFGGPGNDAGNAISFETYGSGAFYITGYVQYNDPANVTFNGSGASITMPSVSACLSAASPNNVYLRGGLSARQAFVAKYNASGSVIWIKPVYSPSCLNGEGLGLCASYRHTSGANYERNVYVTGYFEGNSASFMQSSPCTFINVNGNLGHETGFIAKLSGSNGNALWARSMAVNTNPAAMSIGKNVLLDAASALGYIPGSGLFITGNYQAAANIGGSTITHASSISRGFVAALNPGTGAFNWVSQIQASGTGADVEARDLSCRQSNYDELFALGDFSGSTISCGTNTATNGGGRDLYLLKLTKTTGAVSVLKAEGGTEDQYGYGMDVSLNGGAGGNPEVFISGAYNNAISFAGGSSFGFSGSTSNDHFMAKYDLSLNHLCAAHWDASMTLFAHTLDACDIATSKENMNGSAYLGGQFFNTENPVFNPIPALSTSMPISSYVARWLCCECPPPTITVNRIFPGNTATVNFTYPPCDNAAGIFTLRYESAPNPPSVMPVSWGTPFVVITGLNPLPAIYKWEAQNNCAISSNVVMARTTGVNEATADPKDIQFEVFPNPSENILNFQANQNGSVEIYNLLGELVKQKQLSETSKNNIDVKDLPSGNYLCKFKSTNNLLITKKIQVLH